MTWANFRMSLWWVSLLAMWAVLLRWGFHEASWSQVEAERARWARYESQIVHLEELIERNDQLEKRNWNLREKLRWCHEQHGGTLSVWGKENPGDVELPKKEGK